MQSSEQFREHVDRQSHGDARERRAWLDSKYCVLMQGALEELSREERAGYIQLFREQGANWEPHKQKLMDKNGTIGYQEFWRAVKERREEEEEPLNIEGVVRLLHNKLYAESPEALAALITELETRGYEVTKMEDKDRGGYPLPKDKYGYIWIAKLKNDLVEHKVMCNGCNNYIERRMVQTHNHQCECCGESTYLKFTRGGSVQFMFTNDPVKEMFADICLKVHGYDEESGCILFYPEPIQPRGSSAANTERAKQILDRNSANWHWQGPHIAVRYDTQSFTRDRLADIDIYETRGDKKNYRDVQLFHGKEYDDWSKPPVTDLYLIAETWHWAPLKPSTRLHERILQSAGMVEDIGYYHQDDRTAFFEGNLRIMRTFVERYTTLNVQQWDAMIARTPKSARKMIPAIAKFCHKYAVITDKPNIGNWMEATGDILEGKQPHPATEIAAIAADLAPETSKQIRELEEALRKKYENSDQ